jgi:hypothetical protein
MRPSPIFRCAGAWRVAPGSSFRRASIGCPIRGDTVYGGGAGPLMLLARRIVIPLDPPLDATAPVPAHMRAALQMCGHAAV